MEMKEIKINFLLHISKNRFISRNSQKFLSGLDYNLMVWNLRDAGLIKNDGLLKTNEKVWVLTEKGMEVAGKLPELKKLYERKAEIENEIKGVVDG